MLSAANSCFSQPASALETNRGSLRYLSHAVEDFMIVAVIPRGAAQLTDQGAGHFGGQLEHLFLRVVNAEFGAGFDLANRQSGG